MKSKIILVMAVFSVMFFAISQDAMAKDLKAAYVNLSLVFDSYEKTKRFDEDLQKEAEDKRAERDAMVESVKSLREELELLSPEARAQKQQSVDEKVQELQAFDRDSRLTLRRKRDTMIRDILKEIDDIVQDYGDKNGYDYIFNDRILLFKKDQNDISEEIVKILNA